MLFTLFNKHIKLCSGREQGLTQLAVWAPALLWMWLRFPRKAVTAFVFPTSCCCSSDLVVLILARGEKDSAVASGESDARPPQQRFVGASREASKRRRAPLLRLEITERFESHAISKICFPILFRGITHAHMLHMSRVVEESPLGGVCQFPIKLLWDQNIMWKKTLSLWSQHSCFSLRGEFKNMDRKLRNICRSSVAPSDFLWARRSSGYHYVLVTDLWDIFSEEVQSRPVGQRQSSHWAGFKSQFCSFNNSRAAETTQSPSGKFPQGTWTHSTVRVKRHMYTNASVFLWCCGLWQICSAPT